MKRDASEMKVEFYKHSLGKLEKESIVNVIDNIFLTTGEQVFEFEKRFAGYLNLPYAVGLTSCTAALHLSLLAAGVGKGDEVITTPMTFIATATAIMHTGATPVFVDVEPETGLINAGQIENAISKRTKAIIPVHLYGQMCDMKKIRAIADRHHLAVIEDAAHCIEGKRDGVGPGQLGDCACFSFYATKNITSGEGGAVVSKNKTLADKIRLLRQHGMSKEAADRYSGNYQHWDMIECGWKYNMDNIHGALLIPQLKRIDALWEQRQCAYEKYADMLSQVPDIEIPGVLANSKSAFHLFTVWVGPGRRDAILEKFGRNGVGVAVNYRAIHLLSFFQNKFNFKKGDFPVAEEIGDRTISLPFWPGIPDESIDKTVSILLK